MQSSLFSSGSQVWSIWEKDEAMTSRWQQNTEEHERLIRCVPAGLRKFLILRKEVLLFISITIMLLNFIFLVYDFAMVDVMSTDLLMSHDVYTVMVNSLAVGIICGMLAFVYSSLVGNFMYKAIAMFSIVSNFLVLFIRLIFEIFHASFRPAFTNAKPD